MAVYSFSQVWLYEQCPKKYQYKYVDKLPSEFESSPDLILWTSVHWALERLYQQVNVFKIPTKENLVWKFYDLRQKEIEKVGEWLLYKWEQTQEDYLRRWEYYLSDYYDKNHPFDNIKLIWTEMMLTFSISSKTKEKWNSFRWIIDRLDKEWEDVFVINDYKTNKNLPPEDKQEYQEQLTLYALWVKQKYWKYLKKIKARLHYLHFWIIDEREINDENLNPIVHKYSELVENIEEAKVKYAETFHWKEAFPINPNPYCKYCEYQNLCPLFRHQNYWDETVSWASLWETSIKKLVDRYSELTKNISDKTKEKDSIKEILVDYASEHEFDQLFWNESAIWFSKRTIYTAKEKEEFSLFLKDKNLYEKYSEVPYTKINSIVKNWELTDDEIKKLLEWRDSRRLNVKKKESDLDSDFDD